MPIPGYDPDDVENLLESKLTETNVRSHLADDEWQAYQNGEASLIDLLDEGDIDQLLDEHSN
jgi:hypothetical protein